MANKKRLTVIDAPSNLGLSPPTPYSEPGCYKMPWVLHNLGLLKLIGATYRGTVVPPRYNAHWEEGSGDRNAIEIANYSLRLSETVRDAILQGEFPIVIGGDCSILIGNTLALKSLGDFGLVFIDAHSDYRHPGNSKNIRAAAGEDLAIVTGKGDYRLLDISGTGSSIKAKNVISLGILDSDENIAEMKQDGVSIFTNLDLINGKEIRPTLDKLEDRTDGFWVHLDFDVIDRSEITAVDCPEETGVSFEILLEVLRPVLSRSKCVGIEFTIYDPDLDPDFLQGKQIADFIIRLLE